MRTSILICVSMVVLMFVATGCYEVVYTAEYKGDSCIKFEDAMSYDADLEEMVEDCLGEDGAVEADLFYAMLGGVVDPEDVEVEVKAGKCKETSAELLWDGDYEAWVGEACGFMILAEPDGDGWIFALISDDIEGGKDGTAALSNVTFCFGEGVEVIEPEEGDFETIRAEEEDLE